MAAISPAGEHCCGLWGVHDADRMRLEINLADANFMSMLEAINLHYNESDCVHCRAMKRRRIRGLPHFCDFPRMLETTTAPADGAKHPARVVACRMPTLFWPWGNYAEELTNGESLRPKVFVCPSIGPLVALFSMPPVLTVIVRAEGISKSSAGESRRQPRAATVPKRAHTLRVGRTFSPVIPWQRVSRTACLQVGVNSAKSYLKGFKY